MSEGDFTLGSSFQIDDGELDGLTPQRCFVLGYELALVKHLLRTGRRIYRPVHADNKIRIESACVGRDFELAWMAEDTSESWMQLAVESKEEEATG